VAVGAIARVGGNVTHAGSRISLCLRFGARVRVSRGCAARVSLPFEKVARFRDHLVWAFASFPHLVRWVLQFLREFLSRAEKFVVPVAGAFQGRPVDMPDSPAILASAVGTDVAFYCVADVRTIAALRTRRTRRRSSHDGPWFWGNQDSTTAEVAGSTATRLVVLGRRSHETVAWVRGNL
jgi:hypothetical protein